MSLNYKYVAIKFVVKNVPPQAHTFVSLIVKLIFDAATSDGRVATECLINVINLVTSNLPDSLVFFDEYNPFIIIKSSIMFSIFAEHCQQTL